MGALPTVALFVVSVAGSIAAAWRARRSRRFLRSLMRGLGSALEERDGILVGRVEGCTIELRVVRVRVAPGSKPKKALRVELPSNGRWPVDATVPCEWKEPRSLAQALGAELPPQPELITEGFGASRLAIFDADTSRAWVEWRRSMKERGADCGLEGGRLVVQVVVSKGDARTLRALIADMPAMASQLDRKGRSLPRCLEDGLADATDPRERRARIRMLVEGWPDEGETQSACLAHVDDRDAGVRFEAASGLRAEGRTALADIATDPSLGAALRCDALTRWCATRPAAAEAEPVIAELSRDRARNVRIATIRAAERLSLACPEDALLPHVASASEEEAFELARALARHATEASEQALVRLLRFEPVLIRAEVLSGLSRVGTIACVPAVMPFAKGLLTPAETKLQAKATLQAIRARMGPAEAGRLSLLDIEGDESGSLSASASDGAVSPAGDDEGALSA